MNKTQVSTENVIETGISIEMDEKDEAVYIETIYTECGHETVNPVAIVTRENFYDLVTPILGAYGYIVTPSPEAV